MILLALVASFCADTGLADKTSGNAPQELLETIAAFNEAFQQGNVVALDSLTTEQYWHTNGNSKAIGKKDWFAYLDKREKEITSGNLEVINYQMTEREIRVYGDMAIVTGKIEVTQKARGEIQKNAYRVTNIWIHLDGSWKRAGFHDGKIE